jgi:MerR family transcriptional regulator, redox-sensitive transcriptional activator SoxR
MAAKPAPPGPHLKPGDVLSIGDLAARTGLSVSAIRFYETRGLVTPHRNAGRHRRYLRSDIRRLSFVLICQRLGLPLEDIRARMAELPAGRTPTARDWERISGAVRDHLEARIAALTRLRTNLDGCIGCGCLSLKKCALYNPEDRLAVRGAGPQLVFPDGPIQTPPSPV